MQETFVLEKEISSIIHGLNEDFQNKQHPLVVFVGD